MIRFAHFLALVCLIVGTVAIAHANEKIARETGQNCVACHDKPGSKLLTDQGKYFETTHTLDGFAEVKASFGRCTSCHVRKPGSKKLTSRGRQMAELSKAEDMTALKEWVKENHPAPAH